MFFAPSSIPHQVQVCSLLTWATPAKVETPFLFWLKEWISRLAEYTALFCPPPDKLLVRNDGMVWPKKFSSVIFNTTLPIKL